MIVIWKYEKIVVTLQVERENLTKIKKNAKNKLFSRCWQVLAVCSSNFAGDFKKISKTTSINEDTTEKVDIVELNARLQEIVKKENELRAEIDEIIKEIEGLI